MKINQLYITTDIHTVRNIFLDNHQNNDRDNESSRTIYFDKIKLVRIFHAELRAGLFFQNWKKLYISCFVDILTYVCLLIDISYLILHI